MNGAVYCTLGRSSKAGCLRLVGAEGLLPERAGLLVLLLVADAVSVAWTKGKGAVQIRLSIQVAALEVMQLLASA